MTNPLQHGTPRNPATPDYYWRIPRYLWKYQPRPRVVLFARPPEAAEDLHLLLDLDRKTLGQHRFFESVGGTALLHVLIVFVALTLSSGQVIHEDDLLLARHYQDTTLIAPPPEFMESLRQRNPAGDVSLEQLMAPPGPGTPSVAEPPPGPLVAQPKPLVPAPEPASPPKPLVEPPKIEALEPEPPKRAENVRPAPLSSPAATPPPAIRTEESKPQIAFETPGSGTFSTVSPSSGIGRSSSGVQGGIQVPPSSVQEAIQEVARSGGGGRGLVIGDLESGGGILEARGLPPSSGSTGSSVEMLTDTKGIDFRPYLIQVLAAVRRNWHAVMPASAKLGRRGKVVIQFAIDTSGSVPKLVIAVPSGTEALDRAAVAGISASNPFPPLPPEFTGDEIRLQLNFLYSTKRR